MKHKAVISKGRFAVTNNHRRECDICNRSAFTLVELLVVISIIALLVSILLPSLRSAREQAKMVKCVAGMRGVAQSCMTFANANGDRFQISTDEVGLDLADPTRTRYQYDANGELLSWPVAVAQGAGMEMSNNWEWGVRANSFAQATEKKDQITDQLDLLMCPSDRVKLATPFYPRNKAITHNGVDNDGLRGLGDPANPESSVTDMSYWGYISYGLNEDICGAEVAESAGSPACWRAAWNGDRWLSCKGEFQYPDSFPCAQQSGWRLRGNFDKIYSPQNVGFVFETGRDDENIPEEGYANLVLSAKAAGPYLGDFQQFHEKRMPSRRHPNGKVNILYADMHGAWAQPVDYSDSTGLASEYSPRVRISPYQPRYTE